MLSSILKKLGFNIFTENKKVSGAVPTEQLKHRYRSACLFLLSHLGENHIGDYLEFGVCTGASLHCMFETLKKLKLFNTRLFAFDAFEGLPMLDLIKTGWQPEALINNGEFNTRILAYRESHWGRMFLVKGWFNDTLTRKLIKRYDMQKASLIRINCDDYHDTKEALNFCAPLIKDTSIIFFDNWTDEHNAQGKAFYEFLNVSTELKSVPFENFDPHGKVFIVTNKAKPSNPS